MLIAQHGLQAAALGFELFEVIRRQKFDSIGHGDLIAAVPSRVFLAICPINGHETVENPFDDFFGESFIDSGAVSNFFHVHTRLERVGPFFGTALRVRTVDEALDLVAMALELAFIYVSCTSDKAHPFRTGNLQTVNFSIFESTSFGHGYQVVNEAQVLTLTASSLEFLSGELVGTTRY